MDDYVSAFMVTPRASSLVEPIGTEFVALANTSLAHADTHTTWPALSGAQRN
jgi:hypothetical protein